MHLFAHITTLIFHPIPITVIAVFLIVLRRENNLNSALHWTIVSLVLASIIAAFVLLGIKSKLFNNIDVSNRVQRRFLYPFVVVVSLVFVFLVYLFKGPFTLIYSGFVFAASLCILGIINSRIKASVHVAASAAFVTGLIYMLGFEFIFLLLLVPLNAWARIKEKKHTLNETIVGGLFGSFATIIAIYIGSKIIL